MSSLRSHVRRAAVFCALALAACSPDGEHEQARPPVIVWIEIDTLRADALGCYGNTTLGEKGVPPTPNIDALAADGVRFERAYATAPWTIPSVVSQLSGLWPWEHGVLRLTENCPSEHAPLVPALRSSGFRTAGVMTNFVLKGSFGVKAGFDRWDDALATGHEGSTARDAVSKLLSFAGELDGEAPNGLFLFLWLFDPHYRYEDHEGLRFGPGFGDRASTPYAGSLKGDEDLNALLAQRGTLTDEDIAFLRGRYASEVSWVDRAVGELMRGLESLGLADEALIVFVADHGEEIMDRGWIGHTVTLHEELVRVPWIVRYPKSWPHAPRGRVVARPVSLIDLPATLFELATGRAPDRAREQLGHSRSLVRTIEDGAAPERRYLYLHTDFEPVMNVSVREDKRARAWGVVDTQRNWKWIVDHKVSAGEAPRTLLFDLTRDPLEQTNLAATTEGSAIASSLQRLRALVPEPLGDRRPAPLVLPEEPWIQGRVDVEGAGPALRSE
ncbi:MAG: sulfatase [Planctomycetota bacterium]